MPSYLRFPTAPSVGHVTETQLNVSTPVGQLHWPSVAQSRQFQPGPAGVNPGAPTTEGHAHFGLVSDNIHRVTRVGYDLMRLRVLGKAAHGDFQNPPASGGGGGGGTPPPAPSSSPSTPSSGRIIYQWSSPPHTRGDHVGSTPDAFLNQTKPRQGVTSTAQARVAFGGTAP